jgi:eukaryotic-like serine/threonine-protein kinase
VIGSVLRNRYELTQLLSEGPLFNAYLAKDRVGNKEVDVRLIRAPFSGEPAFIHQLQQVTQKTNKLRYQGIESLIEVDANEGAPFLVTEVSRGTPLAERIRKLAPFSVPVSVGTAISILEALEAVHLAGIVHGDISGSTICILSDGSARLQLSGVWEAYSASTTAGSVMLPSMAPYLAPEVTAGGMPSPQSDVYAVGILLFELLAGRHPYHAETVVSMAMKHATAATPSIRMFNPSVPGVLDEILKKSMSKDPADRYQHAGEMLSDLRMLQDALRFGRNLTWPIAKASATVGETKMVAPRMSAVRHDNPDERPARKEREPRDVPVWVMMSATFCAAVVICIVAGLLIYQSMKKPDVTVPNLKGMTVSEARASLKSINVDLRISGREASDSQPADTILEMSPAAGEKVREGSQVSVRVSSGSRFVEVPDLRGRTVDEAKSLLSSLGLSLDDRVEEKGSSVDRGLIVEQVPGTRTKVARFSKVRAKISSGKDSPGIEPDPASETKYVYDLRIKLSDIEDAVLLRVDLTDSQGTKTIYEQRHLPDDEVRVSAEGFGTEGKFRVFYDGDMVKEVTKKADDADGG